MIDIRRATLADKSAIFDFLAAAYGDKAQYKFPERWEWQFEHNPFKPDEGLPVWVAVNEAGEIVGQIASMAEPLKHGMGHHPRLFWAVDLIVLPSYRNQKIGFQLTKALYEDSDNLMAVPMSEAFRYYMKNFGCNPVNTVDVYSKAVHFGQEHISKSIQSRLRRNRVGNVVGDLVRILRFDRLAAKLVNAWINLRDKRINRFIDPMIKLEQIATFDQRADEIWESVSPHFEVLVRRDRQFLNWKFVDQPHMSYQKFFAIRGGKPIGYIVLRVAAPPESNSGIIADMFISPDDNKGIRSMLAFALLYFKQHQVRYIQGASSVDVYQKGFASLGFKKLKELVPLFHDGKNLMSEDSPEMQTGWFLGRSDHDWDQYPYG